MNLEKEISAKTLPILEKGLEQLYYKQVGEFVKIITSDDEDGNFFESPTKYMEERGLLSFDHIKLPSGEMINLYDDDEMKTIFRRVRKTYMENGEIVIPHAIWHKQTFIYEREVFVSKSWERQMAMRSHDGIWPESEKINFGPLISQRSAEKLREYIKNYIIKRG